MIKVLSPLNPGVGVAVTSNPTRQPQPGSYAMEPNINDGLQPQISHTELSTIASSAVTTATRNGTTIGTVYARQLFAHKSSGFSGMFVTTTSGLVGSVSFGNDNWWSTDSRFTFLYENTGADVNSTITGNGMFPCKPVEWSSKIYTVIVADLVEASSGTQRSSIIGATASTTTRLPFLSAEWPVAAVAYKHRFLVLANSGKIFFSGIDDATPTFNTLNYVLATDTGEIPMGMGVSNELLYVVTSKTIRWFSITDDANAPFAPIMGAVYKLTPTAIYGSSSSASSPHYKGLARYIDTDDGFVVVEAYGHNGVDLFICNPDGVEPIGLTNQSRAFLVDHTQPTFPMSAYNTRENVGCIVPTWFRSDALFVIPSKKWYGVSPVVPINSITIPYPLTAYGSVADATTGAAITTMDFGASLYTINSDDKNGYGVAAGSVLFESVDDFGQIIQHKRFEVDVSMARPHSSESTPLLTLYYSDDAGVSWTSAGTRSANGSGNYYKARIEWQALGVSRFRLYKLVGPSYSFWEIFNARIDVEPQQ